jgi:hypothetical protein
MARRRQFSFNKRQREIKKREKKQKKMDRRDAKRGNAPDEMSPMDDVSLQNDNEALPEPENTPVEEDPAVRLDSKEP